MSKDKKKDKKHRDHTLGSQPTAARAADDSEPRPKMKRKEYELELREQHGEVVALQEWVKASGAKICIVFEGRDTAGKGGTIKAITERVSPRTFRVVALPAPTEREKSQMYVQRYLAHLPAAGGTSSSTAAGTTAPAWSGSWASAPRSRPSGSSTSLRAWSGP